MTLKDIAGASGVSRQVVATVLTGRGTARASAATRERIRRLAREMGYRPHGPARSLATGKTYTIEFQAHTAGDAQYHLPSHYLSLWATVAQFCQERGYNLIVNSNADLSGDSFLRNLRERNIDGIVLAHVTDFTVLEAARQEQMPAVCINPVLSADLLAASGYGVVNFDNAGGIRAALEYLIALGHREIGFIRGRSPHSDFAERWQSYQDTMAAHDLTARPDWVWEDIPRIEGGERVGARILAASARPTAVLAANDNLALGALRVFQARGLNVPEDLSLVGFDDKEAASIVWPGLTTVRLDWQEMARVAARRLFDLLSDVPEMKSDAAEAARFPLSLIERQSCRSLIIHR